MLSRIFKEIYEYRELLFALTGRNIKIKYKQAVMGVAWVFFMPMLAISSGVLFRVVMSIFGDRPLLLSEIAGVMVKSLPWLMFASIVGGASQSLVSNMGLITKIYFPREVVTLAGVLSALFDFVISVTGLIVLLTILNQFASDTEPMIIFGANLLWVPVLLSVLLAMAVGFGLFFAAANLFFRDVKYIVQVMLQFGIFFSLVFFTYEELGQYGWVMLFNPVAPILEGIRTAVTEGQIEPFLLPWVYYSTLVALCAMIAGTAVFDRAEYLFAEYA